MGPQRNGGPRDAGDGQAIQAVLRSLGEAVTNELVDSFNQVDTAYKSDLREMNELNFARFDAKLEQRLAEHRAATDRQFSEIRVSLAALDAKIDVTAARAAADLQKAMRDQTRFFFLAWAVNLAAIIALSFR